MVTKKRPAKKKIAAKPRAKKSGFKKIAGEAKREAKKIVKQTDVKKIKKIAGETMVEGEKLFKQLQKKYKASSPKTKKMIKQDLAIAGAGLVAAMGVKKAIKIIKKKKK